MFCTHTIGAIERASATWSAVAFAVAVHTGPFSPPGSPGSTPRCSASELAAEVARAVDLGAKHLVDYDEYGAVWAGLSDPEGNLVDIGLAGSAEYT